MAARSRIFYHFLAFLTVAVWGVTFISTKVLIGAGLLPAQIFAIRFVIAYVGMCIMEASYLQKRGMNLKFFSDSLEDEMIFVFLGITGGSMYFLSENTALAYTQACNVAFIVCSAPLITLLLTLLCRRILPQRLTAGLEDIKVGPGLVIGTVLALGGMALIIFDGAKFSFSLKGDLLALAAALTWGLYSVFMGRMTTRYGSLFSTRKVFFYGLLTIIPFIVSEPLEVSVLSSWPVIGNLLFLSLAASLGCFAVWNKVMSEIGNVTSTNYVYLNPFFTLVSAMIFLGERMTPVSAAGSAILFAGVFISGRKYC